MSMNPVEIKYVNELRDRITALERRLAHDDAHIRSAVGTSRHVQVPGWEPYDWPTPQSYLQLSPQYAERVDITKTLAQAKRDENVFHVIDDSEYAEWEED